MGLKQPRQPFQVTQRLFTGARNTIRALALIQKLHAIDRRLMNYLKWKRGGEGRKARRGRELLRVPLQKHGGSGQEADSPRRRPIAIGGQSTYWKPSSTHQRPSPGNQREGETMPKGRKSVVGNVLGFVAQARAAASKAIQSLRAEISATRKWLETLIAAESGWISSALVEQAGRAGVVRRSLDQQVG